MESYWLKVQWAEKHINNLKILVDPIEAHPYPVRVKRDPKTRERLYCATEVPEIPPDCALAAGDIFQNLRSALDHLACALVLHNGRNISGATEFPICEHRPKTKKEWARLLGKIEGMRQEAKDHILRIQPYCGGHGPLLRLHKLNIRDKHRLLLAFAAVLGRFNIGQHLRETGAAHGPGHVPDHWVDIWGDRILKKGQIILRDPPHAKLNQNPDIRLQIVINEVGVCEGEHLVQVLKTSLYWVQAIVADCQKFLR